MANAGPGAAATLLALSLLCAPAQASEMVPPFLAGAFWQSEMAPGGVIDWPKVARCARGIKPQTDLADDERAWLRFFRDGQLMCSVALSSRHDGWIAAGGSGTDPYDPAEAKRLGPVACRVTITASIAECQEGK